MTVRALGACHPDCAFCSREWFRWLARRMAQMSRPRHGERVAFAEAAATSIRP